MKDSKNISDAFLFIRNGKSVKQSNESSGVPITRIETIADKSIDINKLGYANIEIDNLGGFENYLLEEGDILMSHINSPKHLGKTAVYENVPDRLIHGMNLLCLRTNKTICDFKYANYFFQSNFFLQDLAKISNKSVNQASFSVGKLKELKIPLPPLKTQQRIAQILDDAAALRDKTKQLLAEYDLLAQAIFLEMFGDPVINPKGWALTKFSELVAKDCPLTYGIVQPGEEFVNGIPCVRPVDLTEQYIKVDNLKKIDPIISNKFKRTILKGGEVLLSVRGSVGVISIADRSLEDANVTRGIVPIWFSKSISNKLFFYYLYKTKRIQNQIKRLSRGATLIQINLKDLRELKLIQPPIELQNQFAEKIALIEQQKALAKQELQESEDLFNCLLQKAFKGELI